MILNHCPITSPTIPLCSRATELNTLNSTANISPAKPLRYATLCAASSWSTPKLASSSSEGAEERESVWIEVTRVLSARRMGGRRRGWVYSSCDKSCANGAVKP